MDIQGIPVSAGIAIGKAFLYSGIPLESSGTGNGTTADPETEKDRLEQAVTEAERQLSELIGRIPAEDGKQEADILNTQKYLLRDPEIIGAAAEAVEKRRITAEQAVTEAVKESAAVFAEMDDDPYLKERSGDIEDIGRRLLSILSGSCTACTLSDLPPDSIVIAETLGPSDTVQLDRAHTTAIVTEHGGSTSHAAILARTMELPAVSGILGMSTLVSAGDTVIVDGCTGRVFIKPEPSIIEEYTRKIAAYEERKCELKKNVHVPCRTKAGKDILLAANIGSPDDIDRALENGAGGVGLFRTEFLYLDRPAPPDEEEQYRIYRTAAEKLGARPLVVRTLDIGGDKEIPYLHLPREDNPFLGTRAIRLCFAQPELFKIQLRALLRAAVYGNIKIMFPMVSSADDILTAKRFIAECARELDSEKKEYNAEVETGIMIEIPAAAIIADELAPLCSFFSIGTNDLTQYTLAVDRTNESLAALYNPFHPAVLALIRKTIEAAHKAGIPCAMCGEFAGNPKAVPLLLKYGLDEFSVSVSVLPETRRQIMDTAAEQAV
jgi:phosphoenolpyruvate-protein phosphotransferase (PTS system enzyme I)